MKNMDFALVDLGLSFCVAVVRLGSSQIQHATSDG